MNAESGPSSCGYNLGSRRARPLQTGEIDPAERAQGRVGVRVLQLKGPVVHVFAGTHPRPKRGFCGIRTHDPEGIPIFNFKRFPIPKNSGTLTRVVCCSSNKSHLLVERELLNG